MILTAPNSNGASQISRDYKIKKQIITMMEEDLKIA